jgi:hypothetical protein
MMGIGRSLFDYFGKNIDLKKILVSGFSLSKVCYLVILFIQISGVSLTCFF